jgi:multiple sugar transport system ATP-binding protein
MAEVALQSVGKVYDNGVRAVRDASFTVVDREFMVLVGPSGCGKSTLLRMIAGLESISSGTVSIDGNVVNDVAPKGRDIAMVFQNYALYPHMSVYDNMAMSLKIRRTPTTTVRERVTEAARLLGIEQLLDRRPSQLSGGQRQRVAVGRAIVRRPKVFLFDEPLSNLDAKMRVETRTEISRLHRRLEATMIYVTHDQTEAMTMGDRIVVLQDGQVQQIDSPLGLYNRPRNRFVASFVGSPAMNVWPARLIRQDGLVLALGEIRSPLRGRVPVELEHLVDRDLLLGLRPEDLHLGMDEAEGLHAELDAMIEVVEPLGSETLLYWRVLDLMSVARVRPTESIQAGAPQRLRLDLSRAHFFDPAEERTLLSWPGSEPGSTAR